MKFNLNSHPGNPRANGGLAFVVTYKIPRAL